MKLIQWMHIFRRHTAPQEVDSEPPTPVAARRTDAAAILRLLSNLLGELGPDRRIGDLTDPRPEDLLEQVEGSGYDLGLPHVQHTAGQMRVLLAAARAGQVRIDRATVDSMRQAIRYLGQHLMKGKRFPREPEELVVWNRRFQAVMATARPAVTHEAIIEDDPIPVMALPQDRPALVMPTRMDPDSAIDAAVAALKAIDSAEIEPGEAPKPAEPHEDVHEPEVPEVETIALVFPESAESQAPRFTVPKEPLRLPSKRRAKAGAGKPAGAAAHDEPNGRRTPPLTRVRTEDIDFDVDELERLIRVRRSSLSQ